jgi:hypothetical protein
MSIKNYVDELSKIQDEIKQNNFKNKILRKRCQVLEDNISEYLKSKDQNGIKYNGQAIIIENKQKHLTKPRKIKQEDVKLLFQTLGVKDPQHAYDQLQEIQKGVSITHQKLTIKSIAK